MSVFDEESQQLQYHTKTCQMNTEGHDFITLLPLKNHQKDTKEIHIHTYKGMSKEHQIKQFILLLSTPGPESAEKSVLCIHLCLKHVIPAKEKFSKCILFGYSYLV